ncbi:hypothetical protein D0865_10087 [Hortaea werneckii]|uniref:Uncharacterized protein n=1 Tax=Hortaea werneckii TaxID=91943 RepID=A0A3M7BZE2_HORWE|nr:hypothetical protein D0865_10087 [Hortaea werneckii]
MLSKRLAKVDLSQTTRPSSVSEEKIPHSSRCIVEEAQAAVDFLDSSAIGTDLYDAANLPLAVLKISSHYFSTNTQ